jgi:2-C-methyl-D-erythritol 2,4-cyclodiphosphate synthase
VTAAKEPTGTAGVRVGSGLDVHPFDEAADRPLVLCGVVVPGGIALAGHSDADVGAHAVADALLGAAAHGDLGSRFGVDRAETAGADSLELLAAVVADVAAAGWRVGNLDLTLVAQRPRLAEHRDAMRANLARVCHLDVGEVSVKFTTTDRLGTIGRGEGIAGWCASLLVADRR